MLETPEAYFHLDDPTPPGGVLYAGPVLLRGWAVGRGACFIVDLRVRVGARVFPAFYGHPRPDVAQFLGNPTECLPAGFEVELVLGAGENQVEFEMCDSFGQWRTLHTPTVVATPAQPVPWRTETDPIGAPVFARALRLVLQRSLDRPLDEVSREIAGWLPVPFVTRYAAVPFHGHLHQPPPLQRANFGRLIVEGWIFHETARIRRVTATVDLQAWSTLAYGNDQPYVARLFPQFPNARRCRAEGFIDAPAHLPQPVSLRVFAQLEDLSWHLCHVQRTHVYDGETDKAPYGRWSPFRFLRAAWQLREACVARSLTVPLDRWFGRALHEVWAEYRTRSAPAAKPPPSTSILRAPTQCGQLGHVLLATHNLNYEGAPLFLLELARHLSANGTRLSVVSGAEGPLRSEFEKLTGDIIIANTASLLNAQTVAKLETALDQLATPAILERADLVIANTISAWWAVHLASRAGRPSLLYIHESTTPDAFFYGQIRSDFLPFIKCTFAIATHVSFLTEATRRYYYPVLRRPNHSLNAGWIDLERIVQFRAHESKATLRRALGLSEDRRLVVNIGTVCDRKGQHIFARAVDLLWRRRPALAAAAEFLIVGGRHTFFDAHVTELVRELGRTNLSIKRETPTPYAYYGAADFFVCSSYEESFPRVVLEAMGFGLPIVSTNVHGVPEMVRHGSEALLVPPGDPSALADAIATLLADSNEAQRLAANAQRRVASEYDARTLLPRHAALAASIASNSR